MELVGPFYWCSSATLLHKQMNCAVNQCPSLEYCGVRIGVPVGTEVGVVVGSHEDSNSKERKTIKTAVIRLPYDITTTS